MTWLSGVEGSLVAAWVVQLGLTILLCFLVGKYALSPTSRANFAALSSISRYSARFNVVYTVVCVLRFVVLGYFVALEHEVQTTTILSGNTSNCSSDEYAQCAEHAFSQRLVSACVISTWEQACVNVIWSMFVVEWILVFAPEGKEAITHKIVRSIQFFNLVSVISALAIGVAMLSVSWCQAGCISNTYVYLHMVLQFQKTLLQPMIPGAIAAVGVFVYRRLRQEHSVIVTLKYLSAVCVCIVLQTVHTVLDLLKLKSDFVPVTYLWSFYTNVAHTDGDAEDTNNTTAFLMWAYALGAIVPLLILHHINTGHLNAPLWEHSSAVSASSSLFDPLVISTEGSFESPTALKKSRRVTVMEGFVEDFTLGLVHQPRPLRGKHLLVLGSHPLGHQLRKEHTLKISDALTPSKITFACTAAYLEFRYTECLQWSRSSMARWDKAIGLLQHSAIGTAASPSLGIAMSTLHEEAAFRDLSSWRAQHVQAWEDQLQHLKDMSQANRRWCDLDGQYFKPSVAKKEYLTAGTATNLQHYVTSVDNVELGASRESRCQFNITTVGAFASHWLGGKNLMALSEEMQEVVSELETERNLQSHGAVVRLEMQIASLRENLEHRTTLAFGQALSAAISTLLMSVSECLRCSGEEIGLWCEIGYLFQMQSLLSTQGHEIYMLKDMSYVMNELKRVSVVFHSEEFGGWELVRDQQEHGLAEGDLLVHVPIPAEQAAQLEQLQLAQKPIKFVPCLFTLGVNEMQSIASAIPGIGEPQIQSEINAQGYADLREYWEAFGSASCQPQLLHWMDLSEAFTVTETQRERAYSEAEHIASSDKLSIWKSLHMLVEKHEPSEKDVQLLVDSAMLCRAMHGGRATCCKSAKDRTSMASTLELALLVAAKGLLGDEPYSREQQIRTLIKSLRGDAGVRLHNCELNTGKKMYAFNVLQQRTLPDLLKPPPEFAGSCAS